MQLILHLVESQLLPYIENEIEGILGMLGIKRVEEFETVLLETENIQLLVVKINIELAVNAGETAMMQIRQAEEKYKAKHGVYTGDFPTLVKGKYLPEDAQYIPYADGKKFTLAATVIVGKSGKQIPVMECGAEYESYLDGLDEVSIQQKIEEANYAGNYPGLKIGDLTTDNNNAGNW